MKRLVFEVVDWCAWFLVELAFRTDCWGPFAWSYRLGCKLYGWSTDYGEKHGFADWTDSEEGEYDNET